MRLFVKIIVFSQMIIVGAYIGTFAGQVVEKEEATYYFSEGKFYKTIQSGKAVDIGGEIMASFLDGKVAWFISRDGENFFAGVLNDGEVKTFPIPIVEVVDSISRLQVYENRFFYIVQGQNMGDGLLMRFDLNRGVVESVPRVLDFRIIGGKMLLLKRGALNYNGMIIPLARQDITTIESVVNERIVFIRGGEQTEICDIGNGKNFYQYGKEIAVETVKNCNLMIEFIDEYHDENQYIDNNMIYYRVVINGVEEGRTEIGPASVYKRIYLKGVYDNYNIISMERWQLNKNKGKYERLNNINQPETVRIYLPSGRFLKINVGLKSGVYVVQKNVFSIRKEVR